VRLQVLLPARVLADEEPVGKVSARGPDGAFTLLPRHVDLVSPLVPGLLSWVTDKGEEVYAAVDEGLLVKSGDEVLVSTRNGAVGPELGELRRTVEEEFSRLDETERRSRSAVNRLEASFVRRFLEFQSHAP
jgi:F-type H+-transporting ATPase subunit epsilon